MSASEFRYCPHCRTALEPRPHGGKERLACPQCDFVHWQNPVPVVAAIVERAGCVVLVRSHGRPPTWYGLVAGFLEAGEHPDDAVLREVREELGLDIPRATYIGTYAFERLNQILFVYHVDGGNAPITLGVDELADYREIPLERVKPWPQGTGPGLRDWLVSRGYNPTIADFGTPQD
jgi:NADH pyrophosphatase NudC (nudix superfamily)